VGPVIQWPDGRYFFAGAANPSGETKPDMLWLEIGDQVPDS
jgi:hypothetical protein